MELTIYTLLVHIVENGSELMLESTPYVDLDLAKKRFKEIVDDDERKNALKKHWTIETDTPTDFLAYEDGYYCQNHTLVSISEDIVSIKKITTLADLRDYINSKEDYPLDVNDIIAQNGWVDETSESYYICNDGTERLEFNSNMKAVIVKL